jgi:hypothetical protein
MEFSRNNRLNSIFNKSIKVLAVMAPLVGFAFPANASDCHNIATNASTWYDKNKATSPYTLDDVQAALKFCIANCYWPNLSKAGGTVVVNGCTMSPEVKALFDRANALKSKKTASN